MSEEQTFSTLRFASEAKKIRNHAKVNEILDHQGQMSRLKKEMEEERKKFMKEIEDLHMKVITSSQPAPPRSSSKKPRRETNPLSTHSVHNSYKEYQEIRSKFSLVSQERDDLADKVAKMLSEQEAEAKKFKQIQTDLRKKISSLDDKLLERDAEVESLKAKLSNVAPGTVGIFNKSRTSGSAKADKKVTIAERYATAEEYFKEECSSSEESEDEEKDPLWRKTPLHRRIREERKSSFDDSSDEELETLKLKKKVSGGEIMS